MHIHSHDRNASVSRFLDSEHPEVIDAYDTWHASKEVKKTMNNVAKVPKNNWG